jgi:hypothetical protein
MDVVSIMLGWLLGMLSPVIVSRITRHYKKNDLHEGILAEVNNVKTRVVFTAHLLCQAYGEYDRDFVRWCLENVDSKNGKYTTVIDDYKIQLDYTDEQFIAYRESKKLANSVGQSIKKFYLSFTDLHLTDISLFTNEFQLALFELRSRIELLNSEIDLSEKYFFMTFSSDLTEINHALIQRDLIAKYIIIQGMTVRVVEQINVVESTSKI